MRRPRRARSSNSMIGACNRTGGNSNPPPTTPPGPTSSVRSAPTIRCAAAYCCSACRRPARCWSNPSAPLPPAPSSRASRWAARFSPSLPRAGWPAPSTTKRPSPSCPRASPCWSRPGARRAWRRRQPDARRCDMASVRLTAAQATIRWLAAQYVTVAGRELPYFAGAWAIFGHGNVAGLGEALYAARGNFPTWRAHNEQGMAHAAIAYAKQMRRRRAMVCTSSIGPGATNMVTAAALAHADRLPVLFLPGDVFASRHPDPVLQQIEDFADGTVSVNDCFRPVSRYFDRITRPGQIMDALPKALATLLDPACCGPATLAFCQDVQAEAYDYPEAFFTRRLWGERRQRADQGELDALVAALKAARHPLLVAGGGVLYSEAEAALATLAEATGLAVAETQAGKGALPWNHPCALGSIGVTGASAANAAAARADLVIGVGTRLADFTTGSR